MKRIQPSFEYWNWLLKLRIRWRSLERRMLAANLNYESIDEIWCIRLTCSIPIERRVQLSNCHAAYWSDESIGEIWNVELAFRFECGRGDCSSHRWIGSCADRLAILASAWEIWWMLCRWFSASNQFGTCIQRGSVHSAALFYKLAMTPPKFFAYRTPHLYNGQREGG